MFFREGVIKLVIPVVFTQEIKESENRALLFVEVI